MLYKQAVAERELNSKEKWRKTVKKQVMYSSKKMQCPFNLFVCWNEFLCQLNVNCYIIHVTKKKVLKISIPGFTVAAIASTSESWISANLKASWTTCSMCCWCKLRAIGGIIPPWLKKKTTALHGTCKISYVHKSVATDSFITWDESVAENSVPRLKSFHYCPQQHIQYHHSSFQFQEQL